MKQCKLIVRDAVNVRFEGLDATIRKKMADSLRFMVPEARHMPQYRLGRWDGTVSFCSLSGSTYLNLLDHLLPILDAEQIDIEIDDRRPPIDYNLAMISEAMFIDKLWPIGHDLAGQPIMLRDYQVSAIQLFADNFQSVQQIATGAGKTLLTAALSWLVEPYGRSMVIVPNKSLVTQTENDYRNVGLDVGVFYGDRKEWGHRHTICTWQSLSVFSKKSKKDKSEISIMEMIEGVNCVIVDECFAKDTMIQTPDGLKPIQEFHTGDKVMNWSESEQIFKEDEVVDLHVNLLSSASEEMYELDMDNGETLRVTANHKFLTQRGWVRTDELNFDDELTAAK